MQASSENRFALLDLLKTIASHLIVLHHLAFYGPMSDHARALAPGLIDFLGGDARIVVQVFLVAGGFMLARSMALRTPAGLPQLAGMIAQRFIKLVPPYLVAILLAVLASAIAAQGMQHDSISPPPSLQQLGAHVLLLQGVLGYDGLSAGAWYVAIDFQLFALASLMLWLGGRAGGSSGAVFVMVFLILLSLLVVNRQSEWDDWAMYFMGSYGMGILAWWASEPHRARAGRALLLAAIILPAMLALALDFRSRIALALVVALALMIARAMPWQLQAGRRWIDVGGRVSYALFLVHFPVCLLVNAAFTRLASTTPVMQAVGMVLAWALSLGAAFVFHRRVELPLARLAGQGFTLPAFLRKTT